MKKETRDYLMMQWGKILKEHSLLDRYNPDLLDSLMGLRKASFPLSKDSAIPIKYKELIIVAIEVATGRGGNGIDHSRRAIEAGASLRQLVETLGLCIYLTGMTTWVDTGKDCLLAAEETAAKINHPDDRKPKKPRPDNR